ncbi:MAG: hypothetical protein ABIQ57_17815 [Candidatus Kapaibacterium sp.]
MNYDWDAVLTTCAEDPERARLALADLPLGYLLHNAPPPADGNPYGRVILHAGDLGEILLIRWRPDTFCAPHNHGDSRGYVRLLEGTFVEQSWEMIDGSLIPTSEHSLAAPAIIPISRNSIHSMKSIDGGASLHCYFPSVSAMRVYDPVLRETLTVGDDCGAWIPADATQILARSFWISGAATV